MNRHQFYVLDTTEACDTRLFAGGQWVNDTRQRCPVCGVLVETEPSEIAIALNHLGKHGFAEHLWNSHSLPIFRQDLIELWQTKGLSGFVIRPVRIVGWYRNLKKPLPKNLPSYYRLVARGKVRLNVPTPLGTVCPRCGFAGYAFPKLRTRLTNGIRIDPTSWDGSDFFGLAQYVFVFCTRRVAETTLQAGYSRHIVFIRTQDFLRWEEFDMRKGWTPEKHRQYVESFLIRRIEDL